MQVWWSSFWLGYMFSTCYNRASITCNNSHCNRKKISFSFIYQFISLFSLLLWSLMLNSFHYKCHETEVDVIDKCHVSEVVYECFLICIYPFGEKSCDRKSKWIHSKPSSRSLFSTAKSYAGQPFIICGIWTGWGGVITISLFIYYCLPVNLSNLIFGPHEEVNFLSNLNLGLPNLLCWWKWHDLWLWE